eukprot:12403892-Karenia_brevis.AAC.1
MLATRCESQMGADWMCVAAAFNLHWRFIVLQNALGLAVQHIPHDGGLDEQVSNILDTMQLVWEAYHKNIVAINGCERHINANFRLVLQDNNITETAKSIINGWINPQRLCQAVKRCGKNRTHLIWFRV